MRPQHRPRPCAVGNDFGLEFVINKWKRVFLNNTRIDKRAGSRISERGRAGGVRRFEPRMPVLKADSAIFTLVQKPCFCAFHQPQRVKGLLLVSPEARHRGLAGGKSAVTGRPRSLVQYRAYGRACDDAGQHGYRYGLLINITKRPDSFDCDCVAAQYRGGRAQAVEEALPDGGECAVASRVHLHPHVASWQDTASDGRRRVERVVVA